jgi:hypothetical protein
VEPRFRIAFDGFAAAGGLPTERRIDDHIPNQGRQLSLAGVDFAPEGAPHG